MTEHYKRHSPPIETLEDLYCAAWLVEEEAGECLRSLANQMEVHNNPVMAELFRRMAADEKEHAARIYAAMDPQWRKGIYNRDLRWLGESCPGAVEIERAHYLMQPRHGLKLALAAKQRIHDFFDEVAKTTSDMAVREKAIEFRAVKAGHVRLVEEEIARTPEPDENWNYDDDPPVTQE